MLPAPKVHAFLLEGKVTQQESDQIDKSSTWETGAGGSEVWGLPELQSMVLPKPAN